MKFFCCLLTLTLALLDEAESRGSSHQLFSSSPVGRLVDPPSRGTLWRFGFFAPKNEKDAETDCGGFVRMWRRNGGRCGVCGDAWDLSLPRPHEEGGEFSRGIVGRVFRSDTDADVAVELLQHGGGHFAFELLPLDDAECAEPVPLRVVDTNDTKYALPPVRSEKELHRITVQIPDAEVTNSLNCSDRCVLRWRYVTQTHLWPCLQNGTLDPGCGPQPEARACADVRIVGDEMKEEEGQKSRELVNDEGTVVRGALEELEYQKGDEIGNGEDAETNGIKLEEVKTGDVNSQRNVQVGVSIEVEPEDGDPKEKQEEGEDSEEESTIENNEAEGVPEAEGKIPDEQAILKAQFEAVRDALGKDDGEDIAAVAEVEPESGFIDDQAKPETNDFDDEVGVEPGSQDIEAAVAENIRSQNDTAAANAEYDGENDIAEGEAEASQVEPEDRQDQDGRPNTDQRLNNKFAKVAENLLTGDEDAKPEAEGAASFKYEERDLEVDFIELASGKTKTMQEMNEIKGDESDSGEDADSEPRSFLFPDEYSSKLINSEGGVVDDAIDNELGETDKTAKNDDDQKSKKKKRKKRRKRKEKKEDEEILQRYLRASADYVKPIEMFVILITVIIPFWI